MVLISSCRQEPQLQLLRYHLLSSFPSASAIEYNDGKLYLFGDDAAYMLILDTAYHPIDSIRYISDTAYRLSKETKPDIESTALVSSNSGNYLYALSSLSTKERMKLFFFPLLYKDSFLRIDLSPLAKKLQQLPELNIEGLAFVKGRFVMANRANKTHAVNKLIIDDTLFKNTDTSPRVIDISLKSKTVAGVSGLYYVEEEDILFFTASEEDTPSATQDGAIGDSYLGWISSFSSKMNEKSVRPEALINLSAADRRFVKQKIESVCIEKINRNEFIMDLAADNDNGSSSLFKVRIKL
jgi:hypothetical protein